MAPLGVCTGTYMIKLTLSSLSWPWSVFWVLFVVVVVVFRFVLFQCIGFCFIILDFISLYFIIF